MIPTFTNFNEIQQCNELRAYFSKLGANIKVNVDFREDEHLQKSLEELISVLEILIDEDKTPKDVECVLNSIVSLLIQVPHTQSACQKLIFSFCQKISTSVTEKTASACIRVLQNLFEGLGINNSLKYDVYLNLIEIGGKFDQVHLVYDDLTKLNTWFNAQTVGVEKVQRIYRLLHRALNTNNHGKEASKVMVELLGTYTAENASNAREDAHKCIVTFISDPNTFLMDHLLTLKPVKILEGEPIHDLLTIFVSEKLSDYINFYNNHKSLIESLGLSHEKNLRKMRLLTFMQIAENKKEIQFDNIKTELQLSSEEVESFIVDVLRTKLVKAKIDQLNKVVLVTSTMHRTFGKSQWRQLRDTLLQWQINLEKVHNTIHTAMRQNTLGPVPT